MKVAIVGSRSGTEKAYAALKTYLPANVSEIISGGAAGVLSREMHLPIRIFTPDYSDGSGKLAPLKRNTKIVEAADLILVFWDGSSPGSRHVMSEAVRLGKPLRVIHL